MSSVCFEDNKSWLMYAHPGIAATYITLSKYFTDLHYCKRKLGSGLSK